MPGGYFVLTQVPSLYSFYERKNPNYKAEIHKNNAFKKNQGEL